MLFGAAKQSLCGQLCLDIVPSGEAVLAFKWSACSIQGAIEIEDVDHLQLMSLSDSKVIEVMGWCDLHRASTEAGINQHLISNDGDFTIDKWMKELLAVPSFGNYAAGTTTELLLKEVQEMLIANSAALRQPGIGVGDTGAGLVMIGSNTLKKHEARLREKGMRIIFEQGHARFKFGNDQVVETDTVAIEVFMTGPPEAERGNAAAQARRSARSRGSSSGRPVKSVHACTP